MTLPHDQTAPSGRSQVRLASPPQEDPLTPPSLSGWRVYQLMLHYSNSRYAAALARRLSLALRGLALRPWSILSERRERALSDRATPSCRCYRHSVNAPVAAQIPCFATMSAADLALRGLLAPTRPCCPARVCACSSDPTWVASLSAYSLHRAVATVNMDAAAVNIMMALVLPSRRPGFGSGHQTQR